AFVYVGRPLMERHGGYLEEKAGSDGDHSQQHEQVGGTTQLEGGAHDVEICARDLQGHSQGAIDLGHGADAIQQREAVGQQARTEGAEQQIFHGGLVGAALVAQKAGEDVKADGHGFEAEKLHDQVVTGGHEHHADGGKQEQRVVFAVMFVFDLEIANGKQNDQRRRDQKDHSEKQEKRVDDDGAIEAANGIGAQRVQPVKRDATEDHTEHKVEKQNRQAEEGKLHLRQDEEEVVAKCGGIHAVIGSPRR